MRIRIVDKCTGRAVTYGIKQDLRLAPRSPRRSGVGKGDAGRGCPAVVGHQPQAEILAPRHGHHVTDTSPSVPFRTMGVASDSRSLQVGAPAPSTPAK